MASYAAPVITMNQNRQIQRLDWKHAQIIR
ncbi:MAG: hypothetical protein RBS85_02980 [Methanofastidiosum sp.]|nr:hypothetical protein [Methanofastidiosum sp.]